MASNRSDTEWIEWLQEALTDQTATPPQPWDGGSQLLTAQERDCMSHLRRAANLLHKITRPPGSDYEHDWNEAAHHIHILQRMILSQAAGRAYPDEYRLLGNPFPRGFGRAEEATPPKVTSARPSLDKPEWGP